LKEKNNRLFGAVYLSSLDLKFIKQYSNSLYPVDVVFIFYTSKALKIKNRTAILSETIEQELDHNLLIVFTQASKLQKSLLGRNYSNVVFVTISSMNFEELIGLHMGCSLSSILLNYSVT